MLPDIGARGHLDAGLTYLGQMVSHDLVAATQPDHRSRQHCAPNLNLDSIYPPEGDTRISRDAKGRFDLNRQANPWDLPRDNDNVAIIPEPRNDENAIIAQLHLFWVNLHNFLIDNDYSTDFETARRQVIQLFHLVVIEEFLRSVINADVYRAYFRENEKFMDLPADRIPDLFSRAVFRFGHSMVRGSYKLNESPPPFGQRFKITELVDPLNRPIPEKMNIEWERLFGIGDDTTDQFAGPIDTIIAKEMGEVPTPSGDINIVKKNLLAGLNANLPEGVRAVEDILTGANGNIIKAKFGLQAIGIPPDHVFRSVPGLTSDNLPLWPYVLLEAKLSGTDQLGIFGSLIVAEVLRNAMETAEDSVYISGTYNFESAIENLGSLKKPLSKILQENHSTSKDRYRIRFMDLHQFMTSQRGYQSMNSANNELDDWVAGPGDQPALVKEPIYIEFPMITELFEYHPTNDPNFPCRLMLVAEGTGEERYARFNRLNENWHPGFSKIMEGLKFRVSSRDGMPVLEAFEIPPYSIGHRNWVVTSWTVTKTKTITGARCIQDVIEWKTGDGEQMGRSVFTWDPYNPIGADARVQGFLAE
jgi:hypothetical protein